MINLLEKINKEKRGTFKLGDLVFINKKNISKDFSHDKIEYIDTSSVTNNKFEKPSILDIKDLPSRAKRLVEDGDTIISTVRPSQKHFGYISNPKPNTVVSTGFAVLTPKNIDPYFLYLYLTKDEITRTLNGIAEATTTTFPAFRPDVLEDMEVIIPDLPIQEKITEILSAYDKKIENNNKIIQTLEKIGETIFKEWFVDFKFPSFEKTKFVNSEIGRIPEGWDVKNLDDVSDILFGFNFKASLFKENGDGVPVVRIRDVLLGYTKTFSLESVDEKYLIKPKDLVIGMDGTFHTRIWFKDGQYLNQRVSRIRSKIPMAFLYQSIKKKLDFLQRTIVGATVAHLSNGDIRNFKIIVPKDEKLLNIFLNFTEKTVVLEKENILLEETRNTLLAKLI
ncbi:restriction endonuclease subunit S [Patescibacteria group bacterium]|nr:restriction endonuclease subunit S [Patescibacteria group bacterium]